MTTVRVRVYRRKSRARGDSAYFLNTDDGWKQSHGDENRSPNLTIDATQLPISRRVIAFSLKNGFILNEGVCSSVRFNGSYSSLFHRSDRFSEGNNLITGETWNGDADA